MKVPNKLQCHSCGSVYPIHETYPESEIKDSLQTVSNAFEGNESIFLCTESRATQRRKGKKHKGRFSYKQEYENPEIQTELDKENIVTIIQDTRLDLKK